MNQSFSFPNLAIRLDRKNYSLWRSTVRSALEAYTLDSFLTDVDPPPATVDIPAVPPTDPTTGVPARVAPNPDRAAWTRKDRLVLLWLRSTLTAPLLSIVARATTSAEAWSILARTFHAQTGARQMHLRQQLQTMSKGSLSVLEYFEQKRALVDSFSDCLCVISDEDFVGYLLHGLGSQFSALRSALSLRTEPISSDELLGVLLQEEARQEEAHQSLQSPSVNAASRHSGGRQSRSDNSSGGKSDRDRSSSSDLPLERPKLNCQICRRSGHEALNCFQRVNFREFPPTNRNAAAKNQAIIAAGKSALTVATHTPSDIGDPWIVDSGASHHVTSDLGNLTLQSNYNGNDGVMVGDELAGTNTAQGNR